jgi:hypothetical protein
MNESFGPWSTAITTGANPQLNTFWKRRLDMLSSLKESNSRVTSRAMLMLACLAIGALAAPTLKWAAEGPLGGLANPADAGSLALLTDGNSSERSAVASQPAKGEPEPVDEYFPRPTEAERQILDVLEQPVDVDFQELALEECIEKLQEQAQIDFWLDRQKLTDEGVALDQPITLKLKGRRLESILNLVLRPVQLEYLIDDDVVKITTASSASEILFTRTYPVGDILLEAKYGALGPWGAMGGGRGGGMGGGLGGGVGNMAGPANPKEDGAAKGSDQPVNNAGGPGPANSGDRADPANHGGGGMGPAQFPTRKGPDFTSLMNMLSTAVAPDSWEELSGPGSMFPARVSNSLVVRQTWAIHRNVLQLIRDLRATKRVRREAVRWPADDTEKEPTEAGSSNQKG